jgi:bla regulator protein blaR1
MRVKIATNTLRRIALAAPTAFAAVSMLATHAQILHPTGPLPSFEVATVKPWQRPPAPPPPPSGMESAAPPKPVGPAKIAPGKPGGQASERVHSIMSARMLIALAYNIPFGSEDTRVLGGPDWVSSKQYEFQAKIDDSSYAAMQTMTAAQQREQVDLMEQSLLADRFKLNVHLETRVMPAYTLTIANGNPKLTPSKEGEVTRISMSGSTLTATSVTLDDWIQSPFLNGRAVVNGTGLTGRYDFTLKWSSDPLTAASSAQDPRDDAPSLLTAVQQQLGLKLVPTKAPVEVIVIDHIEQPTPN